MLSNKPYLMRAFYDWINDSVCTPILVLDATHPRCKVPESYIEGGEIVFNISPTAVRDFKITNDQVEFTASFSGVIHLISAPIKAVLALYAEENNEGIFFDAEEDDGDAIPLQTIEGSMPAGAITQDITRGEASAKDKPFLRLVE
jgi:stringent starvation protein B